MALNLISLEAARQRGNTLSGNVLMAANANLQFKDSSKDISGFVFGGSDFLRFQTNDRFQLTQTAGGAGDDMDFNLFSSVNDFNIYQGIIKLFSVIGDGTVEMREGKSIVFDSNASATQKITGNTFLGIDVFQIFSGSVFHIDITTATANSRFQVQLGVDDDTQGFLVYNNSSVVEFQVGGYTTRVKNVLILESESLTIASDAITISKSLITVDTEGLAASDDLITINMTGGLVDGAVIYLRAAHGDRTVQCQSGGNLKLDAFPRNLDTGNDNLALMYNALTGFWTEVGFGNNPV